MQYQVATDRQTDRRSNRLNCYNTRSVCCCMLIADAREKKNRVLGLVTELGRFYYWIWRTKDVGTRQIKLESVKMETRHIVRILPRVWLQNSGRKVGEISDIRVYLVIQRLSFGQAALLTKCVCVMYLFRSVAKVWPICRCSLSFH